MGAIIAVNAWGDVIKHSEVLAGTRSVDGKRLYPVCNTCRTQVKARDLPEVIQRSV